ncbi:DOMON domain-containing protein [Desulfopila aestuarii]|uniref:DOMON domain-containing protein n=1 Tax=Desulfopila aestuarii DSM 18488 TaxID=1121416 RepID=A0A1M7YC93_9BACT|nr:DOMON domain-containing protein [Desulfopila aestuarii]SHO50233.1 DOMON domain-containing protein [Desulfopila aestuarii DSM 18488]
MLHRACRNIVIGGCFLLATITQGFAADYDHTIEAKDITFSWKIDGDNLAGKIAAKTDGWVGVGFNPSEKMKDANFILGYVKDGETKIIDEYGTTSTGHKNDEDLGGKTDLTLVSGTEEGGMTTIEFVMPLKSGDDKDGELVVDGDTVVLLAYGSGRDSFKSKHKFRTSITVNLGTGAVK